MISVNGPGRGASSIRVRFIMCLGEGTGVKQSSGLTLTGSYSWSHWRGPAGRFTLIEEVNTWL